MQFSLLNSSDIKMVPQYFSYGSAGMPVVPVTISMFAARRLKYQESVLHTHPQTVLCPTASGHENKVDLGSVEVIPGNSAKCFW